MVGRGTDEELRRSKAVRAIRAARCRQRPAEVPYARAVRQSQHRVQLLPQAVVCRICLGMQGGTETAKRSWLATECPGEAGREGRHLAPHPSHLVRVNSTRGHLVCMRCGVVARRAVGRLALRCTGVTRAILDQMLPAEGDSAQAHLV